MQDATCGRVVVIGFDGITWDLLGPWIEEGKLPNLARLREAGAAGVLRSTIVPGSAPAWASFATGKRMGKHGIYQFIQPRPGSYQVQFVNGSHVRGKSLWRLLSEGGKRVIVINVPMTFPAEAVNGCLVAGMDALGTGPGFTHPSDLLQTTEPAVGAYVLEPGMWGYISQGRQDEALARMHQSIEQRLRLARHLMRTPGGWDFLMIVYTESDRVQHFFWKYLDPAHPQYDPAAPPAWKDAILGCYRHLDSALGQLLADLTPQDNLIVCSDHGAGPIGDRSFYLNQWLAQAGYASFRRGGRGGWFVHLRQQAFGKARGAMRRYLSRRTKEWLATHFPQLRDRVTSELQFAGIDWSRTQAYALEGEPLIYINVQGRQPQGIVAPETYEAVRQQVLDGLRALRDPWEGWPILEAATREEAFPGAPWGEAPDIAVFLRDEYTSRMTYTMRGENPLVRLSRRELEVQERSNRSSAAHRREGVLLLQGPAFKSGLAMPHADIFDLAPTILHLFGLPVPEDMDGRVLQDCLSFARPIQFTAAGPTAEGSPEVELRPEEEEWMRQRLEGLGYLDN